jgi:hypothetical protein
MDLLSTNVSSHRSRINMILTKARADSEGRKKRVCVLPRGSETRRMVEDKPCLLDCAWVSGCALYGWRFEFGP